MECPHVDEIHTHVALNIITGAVIVHVRKRDHGMALGYVPPN